MSPSFRWMSAAALAAGALLLASARCGPSGHPPPGDCAPLDGACGAAMACCALSTRGDPLACDADAGACVVECIGRAHDCTNDTGGCCPGYTCQLDGLGYGKCN